MWQTPKKHVFCIFSGLSLKIFRIKFKFSIEFFKSFPMQFLDLETSCYHEIHRKNWKNLKSLKMICLEKYGMDHFQTSITLMTFLLSLIVQKRSGQMGLARLDRIRPFCHEYVFRGLKQIFVLLPCGTHSKNDLFLRYAAVLVSPIQHKTPSKLAPLCLQLWC